MKKDLKDILLFIFCFFALEITGAMCTKKHTKPNMSQETVTNPVQIITYITDTISTPSHVLLLYTQGKIVRYYIQDNNAYRMQLPYFSHEQWHKHNATTRFRTSNKLTPYEYTKLCIWDEISANICAILTARYEYLSSDNPDVIIKRYENTYMDFYFKAIKSGKIHPNISYLSPNEASLLVNGTRDMWMRTFWNTYSPSIERMIIRHFAKYNTSIKPNSAYSCFRNKMLDIGGVKFDTYLQSDVNPNCKQLDIINQTACVQIFKPDLQQISGLTLKYQHVLAHANFADAQSILRHIAISCKLQHELQDLPSTYIVSNQKLLNFLYYNIMSELNTDPCFNKWLHNMTSNNHLCSGDTPVSESILRDIYTYNNVCLYDYIDLKPNNFNMYCPKFVNFCNVNRDTNTPKKDSGRYSDIQYVKAPNFSQPILRNATQSQIKEIYNAISDFEKTVYKQTNKTK